MPLSQNSARLLEARVANRPVGVARAGVAEQYDRFAGSMWFPLANDASVAA